MQLAFVYTPVKDMKEALAFYRDTLGFDEAWREGDLTVSLKVPKTTTQILLDEDTTESAAGAFLVLDDVQRFFDEHSTLDWVTKPRAIPPGLYAAFTDPSGNVIRIMDRTTSKERVSG